MDDMTFKEQVVSVEDRLNVRIGRLERQNQSLKRMTLGLGVLLFAVLALTGVQLFNPDLLDGGGGIAEVVEARSFVLRGLDGAALGEWGLQEEDGSVRFSLFDHRQEPRMNLTVLQGGSPGISFSNQDGQRRMVLGLLPDQTSTLVFADRAGVPRAVFGLTADESANLVFADGNGQSRVGFGVEPEGMTSVMLPDDLSQEVVGGQTPPPGGGGGGN